MLFRSYDLVNDELTNIKIARPAKSKMWRIVGVLPQLHNDQHKKMLKQYRLASLNDFKSTSILDDLLEVA